MEPRTEPHLVPEVGGHVGSEEEPLGGGLAGDKERDAQKMVAVSRADLESSAELETVGGRASLEVDSSKGGITNIGEGDGQNEIFEASRVDVAPRTGLDSDGSRKVDDGAKEERSSSYADDATGRQGSGALQGQVERPTNSNSCHLRKGKSYQTPQSLIVFERRRWKMKGLEGRVVSLTPEGLLTGRAFEEAPLVSSEESVGYNCNKRGDASVTAMLSYLGETVGPNPH